VGELWWGWGGGRLQSWGPAVWGVNVGVWGVCKCVGCAVVGMSCKGLSTQWCNGTVQLPQQMRTLSEPWRNRTVQPARKVGVLRVQPPVGRDVEPVWVVGSGGSR